MTPKEQAEELYNIFDMIIYSDQDEHDQCKRCAIRCVDEIQEHAQMIETEYNGYDNPYQYFLQVKQEINKL